MLRELLDTPGVVETCELRARVGFMALHGGLEANTWEIAREAAGRGGASLYGVVQPEDLSWHIPSSRYALADSPALRTFCDHVTTVISLHGYGGVRDRVDRWRTICVGGAGRNEAALVADALRRRLDGYVVLDDLDEIPPAYRGLHADNPVNCTLGVGVQVELPPRVRGIGPAWSDHPFDREPWVRDTAALINALVEVAATLAERD